MRRQVITAGLLGLTLATTALPALADDGGWSGSVNTDGPGYDVRADVDYHHTAGGGGSSSGGGAAAGDHHKSEHHGDGGGESVDGMSRTDAEAELDEAARKYYDQQKKNLNTLCRWARQGSPSPLLGKDWKKTCNSPAAKKEKPAPKPDPVVVGRHAALQLTLPGAAPHIEPSPERNRWHSAAVGQALWLSVNDPTATKRESLTFMGQVVQLSARRNGLSFEMGDGHTVHCAATTPWSPSVEPGAPSPTCGYTYQQAAPAGGYKVTAITSWDVTWSVLGHTGTVHIQKAGGQMLPVGELESVVTRR